MIQVYANWQNRCRVLIWVVGLKLHTYLSRVCLQESPRLLTKNCWSNISSKIQGMCIQFQIEPHKIMHVPGPTRSVLPDPPHCPMTGPPQRIGSQESWVRLKNQLSEALKYAKVREWRRILNLRSCRKCVFSGSSIKAMRLVMGLFEPT